MSSWKTARGLALSLILGAWAFGWAIRSAQGQAEIKKRSASSKAAKAKSTPSPKPTPKAATPPALASFTFNVIAMDASGKVIERRRAQALSFAENLGSGVALEMVEIPGGTYLMGSPAAQEERRTEGPQHRVTVPPFYLGKYEVTQAQWRAVAGWPKINLDLLPDPSSDKEDNRPVEGVQWAQAVEFCARLAQKTGRAYRLLSEAEWEYACRAGTTTPFAFGDAITPEIVNYNGNFPYGQAAKGLVRGQTIAVGSLGYANGFGLYDMHGNVFEWCQDTWHISYRGAPNDGSAWEDGDQSRRVARGGAWGAPASNCRSAFRTYLQATQANHRCGFRVAMSKAPAQ